MIAIHRSHPKLGFTLKRFLLSVLVVTVLVAVSSPIVRFLGAMSSARQRVRNDLDHDAIRAAGLEVLDELIADSTDFISQEQLPSLIAETHPSWVMIVGGCLQLEYGGGFGHFGLLVSRNDIPPPDTTRVATGVFYYDTE